ncbi:MAG: HlyD family efflux transporter periplasmic adaptor subunit [Cyclobacteriaceae bacterium]|nr:HlyD family efflux transporter periplasmic adaptor subunit [Cyclobacteriaceae bacterium HetDA_MAG_MS6]
MLNISKDNIDDQLADKQLYSLKTLRTPNLGIYLARVLVVLTVITLVSMFLPWQQNIRGQGRVTALNPANRPQTVESAIPGRIVEWFVFEGDFVSAGDTILHLAEVKDKFFDPNLLQRLSEQIAAKESSLIAKQLKRDAYKNQIKALQESLVAKLNQANNKVAQSILKVQSDSITFEAEKISFSNSQNIFDRNKLRFESGNITLTKFQELETKFNTSKAKVLERENKYLQSQGDLAIARTDLSGIQADYAEKISKATSDLQATLSEINDTEGSIAKIKNEYSNVEVRQDQYYLIAPQSGYLVKALKEGLGETIKEGEAVVTIMPDNPDLAVEMYIRAMDVPLISRERSVRIQFDGWPALQFSGWPSVSVGTFGGVVQVIDRVNNGNGMFRILVKPDPTDDPWPDQLRLGSGIKGWVMLENVYVWYEIWRQLNGFPPSLYEEPGQSTTKSEYNNSSKSDKK